MPSACASLVQSVSALNENLRFKQFLRICFPQFCCYNDTFWIQKLSVNTVHKNCCFIMGIWTWPNLFKITILNLIDTREWYLMSFSFSWIELGTKSIAFIEKVLTRILHRICSTRESFVCQNKRLADFTRS